MHTGGVVVADMENLNGFVIGRLLSEIVLGGDAVKSPLDRTVTPKSSQ